MAQQNSRTFQVFQDPYDPVTRGEIKQESKQTGTSALSKKKKWEEGGQKEKATVSYPIITTANKSALKIIYWID